MVLTPSKQERQAHLHWAKDQDQPCFCNSEIYLDVTKLQATPETLAAIFGIEKPESISVRDLESKDKIELVENGGQYWKLEPQNHYEIACDDDTPIIPIDKIFPLFPGSNEDEKSDRIHDLSKNFYGKIWHDAATPKEFRSSFYSVSSSDEIQAYRQFNWLNEVFGGPSMYENAKQRDEVLLARTMAKHTSSRMTKDHAITWIRIMKRSLHEEFPNESKLTHALGLYWLHFFAFFPYKDDDRREFRKILMEDTQEDE